MDLTPDGGMRQATLPRVAASLTATASRAALGQRGTAAGEGTR
ncbi:DUF6380 family protein [Streptomyces sp. NPDC049915]